MAKTLNNSSVLDYSKNQCKLSEDNGYNPVCGHPGMWRFGSQAISPVANTDFPLREVPQKTQDLKTRPGAYLAQSYLRDIPSNI